MSRSQNTAGRLARLVQALKTAIFRKASGVSAISNSSGSSDDSAAGTRGSRDAATDVGDDGLDLDPLDEAASLSAAASTAQSKNRYTEEKTSIIGNSASNVVTDSGKTGAAN